MNRIAVAQELVRVAKSLVSSKDEELAEKIYDMLGSIQAAGEEREEAGKLALRLIRKNLGPDWAKGDRLPVDDFSDFNDKWSDFDIPIQNVETLVRQLEGVMKKYDIIGILRDPSKRTMGNKERFQRANRHYLKYLPKWLVDIMTSKRLSIQENLLGYSIIKDDESLLGVLEHETEDIQEYIRWLETQKSELQKL